MADRWYSLNDLKVIMGMKGAETIFRWFGDDPLVSAEVLDQAIESHSMYYGDWCALQRRQNLQIVSRRDEP